MAQNKKRKERIYAQYIGISANCLSLPNSNKRFMTFGILVLSFHNVEKELKAVSKRRETVAARFMKSINNCSVFHRVEKRKKRKNRAANAQSSS